MGFNQTKNLMNMPLIKTIQKQVESPNYDDLIERGCLIIEISDKSKSTPGIIPGALVANVKEVKRKLGEIGASTRPILLTSKKTKYLSQVKKTLELNNIEYYIAGPPDNCYQNLVNHQYTRI